MPIISSTRFYLSNFFPFLSQYIKLKWNRKKNGKRKEAGKKEIWLEKLQKLMEGGGESEREKEISS